MKVFSGLYTLIFCKAGNLESRKLRPCLRNHQTHTLNTKTRHEPPLQNPCCPHLSHPRRTTTTTPISRHPLLLQHRTDSRIINFKANLYQNYPRRPLIVPRRRATTPIMKLITFRQIPPLLQEMLLGLRLALGRFRHLIPRLSHTILHNRSPPSTTDIAILGR